MGLVGLVEQEDHMSLAILAAVVACVSWTVTQEEVFREPLELCKRLSLSCRLASLRNFFYLFPCEYCFSHYVAALVVLISGYRLHSAGGFGAVVAWLSLVWTANIYMSLFRLLR